MKKRISLLFSLFFLLSCENTTVDITVLPEETTRGIHTFGCLVDGWVYVGGRYDDICCLLHEDGNIHISTYVKPDRNLSFTILRPQEGTVTLTDVSWDGLSLPDATATITRFDTRAQIISGRFGGGRITEGRFDLRYTMPFQPWAMSSTSPPSRPIK
jgi:hypothetical protein